MSIYLQTIGNGNIHCSTNENLLEKYDGWDIRITIINNKLQFYILNESNNQSYESYDLKILKKISENDTNDITSTVLPTTIIQMLGRIKIDILIQRDNCKKSINKIIRNNTIQYHIIDVEDKDDNKDDNQIEYFIIAQLKKV